MKTIYAAAFAAVMLVTTNAHAQNITNTPEYIHNFFGLVDQRCPFLNASEMQLNAKVIAQLATSSRTFSEAIELAGQHARAINCNNEALFNMQQMYRGELERLRKIM